jgi:hypothetical protein
MITRAPAFEDYVPLRTLYARFDAIAEGSSPGNSTAAHQAVLDRLAANQRIAEALGWTECALERQGGRGRLLARGVRPAGTDREVIPDWIPGRLNADDDAPSTIAAASSRPPPRSPIVDATSRPDSAAAASQPVGR